MGSHGPRADPGGRPPTGSPAWWRDVDAWASRTGTDQETKRATISVVVPKGARTWPDTVIHAAAGPFDEAYSRGITEELPEPTRRTRALPPAPFALHGAVITPDGAWSSGYVTVANGLIDRVSTQKPTDVAVLETDGVILPGLLDLHGHPEFNVFAAWEPPKLYDNRYAWRRSKPYQALVRDPQNLLLTQVPPKTQTRYAEVRALVGGVTGIQGASGASSASSSRSCATSTSGPSGRTAHGR